LLRQPQEELCVFWSDRDPYDLSYVLAY